MGLLGVNLTDVDTGYDKVECYPAGPYQVQVKSFKPQNKNSKDYLNWLFEIVNHQEHSGKPIFYDTYLTQNALFRLKRLGVACEAITPDGDVDDALCIGKMIMVELTVKTHRQDTREALTNPVNEVTIII